ncbi:MAG: ABC transporter ATP-binding protein [Betaproteobacteria bacterium]|nr:ABC transporter ATP-binding protein [Betaproteobacteria bacterium]
MSEVLIEARGLHAWYGASHILHGVDFTVRRGETVGLMGRNGMGKTTLLKSMLGLVRPPLGRMQGEVRILTRNASHSSSRDVSRGVERDLSRGVERDVPRGVERDVSRGVERDVPRGVERDVSHSMERDVSRMAPHEIALAGIAYVPEGRGIFPNLSVRENLIMAARPGADGRRDWTFERVMATFPRLAERLDHGGNQLSGGEQQMLTIGRALMTHPELLILDEATEGLAPLISREIWRIVRAIKEAGIATVIVDKNFNAVSAIADRAVILVKGVTVYDGACTALRAQPELHQRHLGV